MYQLKKAFAEHVEKNIIKYIVLLSLLLVGILCGVIFSGNLSADMSVNLEKEIEPLIDELSKETTDSSRIFYSAFLKNAKMFISVFVYGFFVWLIPLTFLNIFFWGFSAGFTVGYLCAAFGGAGMWIAVTSLLPSLLLKIPLCIFVSVVSINNSIKRKSRYLVDGSNTKKYTLLFLVVYLFSHASVFVDAFVIPILITAGCS